MIRALLGDATRPRFRTYDIDEETGAILTCDSESLRVRVFGDARELIESALRGRAPVFYCYGGGRFQVQPVLLEAINMGLRGSGSFYGSSATRIAIRSRDGGKVARFVDAEGILRGDTLGELADMRGIRLNVASASSRAIVTARLLNAVGEIVGELGGSMRGSLASCAFDIFRRVYLPHNFATDSNLNKRAKRALYPGRTEVHRSRLVADGEDETRWNGVVDLNSAYGAAMVRGPIPGQIARVSRRRAPCSISRVTVEVPEGVFPSIPYRSEGGSVYYPVGIWEGWYHEATLTWAEANGAIVREVHESLHFTPWDAPGRYALALYEKRESTTDPLKRRVIKALIQSLAGRLAMRTGYERLVLYPSKKECPHDGEHDSSHGPLCWRALRAGVYLVTDPDRAAGTSHVPATVGVNAVALTMINEGYRRAKERGGEIAYIGTDALHLSNPSDLVDRGLSLGSFRLERRFKEGEYVSPLWYRTDAEVTAAGIQGPTLEDWRALMAGIDVAVPYVTGAKQSVPKGALSQSWQSWNIRRVCSVCYNRVMAEVCHLHPWAHPISADSRPRRMMLPDGTSKPWLVDSLRSAWLGGRGDRLR